MGLAIGSLAQPNNNKQKKKKRGEERVSGMAFARKSTRTSTAPLVDWTTGYPSDGEVSGGRRDEALITPMPREVDSLPTEDDTGDLSLPWLTGGGQGARLLDDSVREIQREKTRDMKQTTQHAQIKNNQKKKKKKAQMPQFVHFHPSGGWLRAWLGLLVSLITAAGQLALIALALLLLPLSRLVPGWARRAAMRCVTAVGYRIYLTDSVCVCARARVFDVVWGGVVCVGWVWVCVGVGVM